MKKIFLSYSRKDKTAIEMLVREMKARGLRPWRDIDDVGLGKPIEDEIRHALASECQGCLLYITPSSIESDYVTRIEMKYALEQASRASGFALVPVFHGVTVSETREVLKHRLGLHVAQFSGIVVPEAIGTDQKLRKYLAHAVQRLLKTILQQKVQEFDSSPDKRIVVDFFSYKMAPFSPAADLVVDWSDFNRSDNTIDNTDCNEILWPALMDVKNTLAETIGPRTILLRPKAIPSCGIVFGFAFCATTGYQIEIEQLMKNGGIETWSATSSHEAVSPLEDRIRGDIPGGTEGMLEVSIYEKSSISLDEAIAAGETSTIGVRALIRPQQDSVLINNDDEACAIAKQVESTLRKMRNDYDAKKIHFALASPIALAVQIGYWLNAMGKIQLYDKTKGGEQEKYVPSFLIGG